MTDREKEAGISVLREAGKHLANTRPAVLEMVKKNLTAVEAARHPNPDVQALAVIAVAEFRVNGGKHDGWVTQIERILDLRSVYL